MHIPSPIGARLGLSGTLEFKDEAGNVLKRVDFIGSVPLADSGLSVEQAQQQLITQEGASNGCDDRE